MNHQQDLERLLKQARTTCETAFTQPTRELFREITQLFKLVLEIENRQPDTCTDNQTPCKSHPET